MDISSSLLRIQLPESRWAFLMSVISKAIAQRPQRNLQLGSDWGTQLKLSQLYEANDRPNLDIKTLIVVTARCHFALGKKMYNNMRHTCGAVWNQVFCKIVYGCLNWSWKPGSHTRRSQV